MADRYIRDLFQGSEMEKIARSLTDEKIEWKFVCEGPYVAVAIGKDSLNSESVVKNIGIEAKLSSGKNLLTSFATLSTHQLEASHDYRRR
ncbi:hypothetical protein T11_9286 [Trichinella zimbabwensis]|uniref:Uncharacterized protein n=1 Tax=Trichinella zimbabwensis TaxID=268475 RepID=A0A0V1HUR2_9BILA|nr:hypothetical protein T11_9286 [Trichinella zimbabwensis]